MRRGALITKNKNMEAEKFLNENCDWFDKSPGGEKLYFESEVIRMMNDFANEALRIHDVVGRSEQLFCPHCEGTDIQENFYTDTYGCNSCGHSWAK